MAEEIESKGEKLRLLLGIEVQQIEPNTVLHPALLERGRTSSIKHFGGIILRGRYQRLHQDRLYLEVKCYGQFLLRLVKVRRLLGIV
ncbi:hypothetical protein OK016_19935 [Vibrio chagasii]|nr:hypothetical protein [Vibrio chagasii]